MPLQPPKYCVVLTTALALCLLIVCGPAAQGQTPTPTPTPAPTPVATPAAATCVTPLVYKLTAYYKKSGQPWDKGDDANALKLARKRFYLSTRPFNLDKIPDLGHAPTRRSYYQSIASPQLLKWLEANNCDTVYCRELRSEEVTCKTTDAACVPEFSAAYSEALRKLNNNPELARRWITNYEPLSKPELRVGFYQKKKEWLESALAKVERAAGLSAGAIKSAMTDRKGEAYFYDLCVGTDYYISTVAPVEVEGDAVLWETAAIKLKPQGESPVRALSFANVPQNEKAKVDKGFFAGKRVTGTSSAAPLESMKPAGQ